MAEAVQSPLPAARPLPPGARVLLIRLSALGDVLFALEALASLVRERPDVRVDFLVEDRFASLLQGHPQIERLLVFPRRRWRSIPGALRTLRAVRYDAVLDLHGNLKSAFWTLAARAHRKIGLAAPIAREQAHRVYRERVVLPLPTPHRAEWGLALLRAVGLRGDPARPKLPAARQDVQVFADAAGPRVALHPGTSEFARFKRWPLPRYAELARRLRERGVSVAVSVGPGEEVLREEMQAAVPGIPVIPGAALGLVDLAGVYGRCDLLVAAAARCSGPVSAAGTRVLALFGPKDENLYGPRGVGHAVAFHDVPCRPCKRRDCVSPQCVLGLDVERVERLVLERLGIAR